MHPHTRTKLIKNLEKHLEMPSPPIQVLMGPRQVGKTTAIQAFLKKWEGPSFYHTADLLSPPDITWIETQWLAARSEVSKAKKRGLLVFDEVQKVPRWSEAVKKCFDEDRRSKFPMAVVLLGSSSLLVQRGLTESLAGRFEVIYFPHWSFEECRTTFGINLDQFLFYGGYPGALQILIDSGHDATRWAEYVRNALIETVLNKDILLLSPVTKPALFRQVFQLACSHPSEVLSLNKMMGQLHEAGNVSTIASYLRLLDAAMLLKPLDKFSGNRLRQKISSSKLLVLNNALINSQPGRNFSQLKKDKASWGRLLENAVGASLINNNMGSGTELYYFRDRNLEVDFILRRGEKILAIEVKTNAKEENEGLKHFLKRNPSARGITTALSGGDLQIESLLSNTAEEIFSVKD